MIHRTLRSHRNRAAMVAGFLFFTVCLAIGRPAFCDPVTPVSLTGSGFTVEKLRNNEVAFSNRKYKWGDIPDQFKEWQFTRLKGGETVVMEAVAGNDGELYLATQSKDPVTETGWERVRGATFKYTSADGRAYNMDVYVRQCRSGESIKIPQQNWSGGILIAPRIDAQIEVPPKKLDLSQVPGTVIAHTPASSGKYIGSPSIVILPGGDYVASHDFFGPKSGFSVSGTTHLYRSSDKGLTWSFLTELKNQFWGGLFVHRGDLYIMGTRKRFGDAVIRRSADGGRSWTEPLDGTSGLLLNDRRCHTANVPVLEYKGRIWRSMEDIDGAGEPGQWMWGKWFQSFMMSAPADSDLLNADNWTVSNRIGVDTSLLDGNFNGFLEGNAVVLPDGRVGNVLRAAVNNVPRDQTAAVISVSDDGKTASFDPSTGLVSFPGGEVKFTVRYDAESQKYWTLSNWIAPATTYIHRQYIALASSADLKTWEIRSIVLYFPDQTLQGFQYLEWVFDGEDLITVSRTAAQDGLGGVTSVHDANLMTFHRIRAFRNQTMKDSVVEPLALGIDASTAVFFPDPGSD